jgi:hypothetical protein
MTREEILQRLQMIRNKCIQALRLNLFHGRRLLKRLAAEQINKFDH